MDAAVFAPAGNGAAAHGFALVAAAQVWRTLLSLGSGVLLARLLAPADFGVVAMAMTAMSLAVLVQDVGLGQATVQRERLDAAHVDAMFWLTLAASAAAALAMALAAPAAAAFYREPRVAPLTAAFALVLLIYGAQGQPMALLQRQMRFSVIAVLDALAASAGFAVAVAVAWATRSYWALFLSTLVGATISLAGAWIACGWRPGPPRRHAELGGLLRFGGGVAGFQVLNFLSRNADNMLIGRFLGQIVLGFYDRAYRLLLFPLQQVGAPMQKVMVPLLSHLQREPARYRAAFAEGVSLMMTAVQPGILVAVLYAPGVFRLLLGERWAPAAPIFQWLGLVGLQQSLTFGVGWLLLSQGRGGDTFKVGAVNAAFSVAAFVIGLRWGAVGVAGAYALSEYLKTAPLVWWIGRSGPVSAADIWRLSWPHVLASGASAAALFALGRIAGPFGWSFAAAALVLSYAVTLAVLALFESKRRMLAKAAALGGGLVRRAPAAEAAHEA
ncbi:MAG: lipopolysaccharide biosynthesis protein [Caulobacteraceae bacterium]|nr:lipopolysaccharide biosynthesis protein [Caulobacteraceae bacterium]